MLTKIKRSLRWLLRKRGRDSGLLFTRENIRIDRELFYEDYEVGASIEVWFDAEKKFGLSLPSNDYVNVYAYITPYTGDVCVTYVIQYADGFNDDERTFKKLTLTEKELILEMVNEVSLSETGLTVDEYYNALENGSTDFGVAAVGGSSDGR